MAHVILSILLVILSKAKDLIFEDMETKELSPYPPERILNVSAYQRKSRD